MLHAKRLLLPAVSLSAFALAATADPLPPDATYRPLPTQPFKCR